MKILSFLLNLILLPFEWLGRLIALLLEGGGRFLQKFLLSPWGLLLPCTIIAAVLISMGLSKNSTELAENYLKSLETCEEREIPVLLEALVELGEPGIPALVQGLKQPREAVFAAVRQKLNAELERWEKLDEESRLRRYRVLSRALLEQGRSLEDEGQGVALMLGRRMLRNLAISSDTPSVGDARLKDVTAISRNCERLASMIETRRKKMLKPNGPENEAGVEGIARFENRTFDPTLMASMGRPFRRDEAEHDPPAGDRTVDDFAVPRAERLQVYHDSRQYQQQLASPYRRPGTMSLPLDRAEETPSEQGLASREMLASMEPRRIETMKKISDAPATMPPGLVRSESLGPVARRHVSLRDAPLQDGLDTDIGRDYRSKKLAADKEDARNQERLSANAAVSDVEFFLPRDLREMPLERIPDLSSARLMRLLQHTDDRYVSEARKTLIARDGFRDVHLKLAFRLFHPAPSVREELVALLPNTTGVQPRVWLSVLLDDPNSDVRYRAASFLATTGDPSLRRLLIERGKRDTDSRIVNLADQLQEQQGNRSRR